jgi:hypothetical protein
MSDNPDVRALATAFEAAVEGQFPQFERCDPKEYERRLDVTLKASLALLSATCAAFIRFYGMDKAPVLFTLVVQNLQRLTGINLKTPITNDPQTPPDRPKAPSLH